LAPGPAALALKTGRRDLVFNRPASPASPDLERPTATMPDPISRKKIIELEQAANSNRMAEHDPRNGADRPKLFVKRYRTEIAASGSSVLSTFIAFPLDSIKTRMQTYKYKSFTDCVRRTYQTEGFRGFFRGVTAPLASVTLVRTISFSMYQRSKYTYSSLIYKNFGIDPLVYVNTPGNYPNFATIACFGAAGATAGSILSVVACPFELTKLSAQVSVLMAHRTSSSVSDAIKDAAVPASYENKGTFKTALNIVKHRGIVGLYSGFSLHLLRDTLGTAIYFGTYESVKQCLLTYRGDVTTTSPLAVAGAGGLCGVVSWALIYPIDSAKSIYQRNCLLHNKGEAVMPAPRIQFFNRRMYRGIGVSMTRSAIVNAIFFSGFEFLKKKINEMEDVTVVD